MNQQPDKLFREKLAGLQKPVSAAAWNRVEAKLHKKINWKLWLNVAASLIVAAIATFLLWPKNAINNQPQQLTQETNRYKTEKLEVPADSIAVFKKTQVQEEQLATIDNKKVKELPGKVQKIETSLAQNTKTETANQKTPEGINTMEEFVEEKPTTSNEEISLAENSAIVTTEPQQEDVGVTIVYTAEEVNEKYLDKKSLAEATSDDRKPSTLRKLLKKAYDLKNNQDPFGDLRQKKNEILALNFKGEKQRSQK
jgi:hypothetical protein